MLDISNIKTFLIVGTDYEHLVTKSNYTIPPPDLVKELEGGRSVTVPRNNGYIPRLLERKFGRPVFCLYSGNFPQARDLYEQLSSLDGLIIPVGHGDINAVMHMGIEDPSTRKMPVFEAHKHYPGYRGYEGIASPDQIKDMNSLQREWEVRRAFEHWLDRNYKR